VSHHCVVGLSTGVVSLQNGHRWRRSSCRAREKGGIGVRRRHGLGVGNSCHRRCCLRLGLRGLGSGTSIPQRLESPSSRRGGPGSLALQRNDKGTQSPLPVLVVVTSPSSEPDKHRSQERPEGARRAFRSASDKGGNESRIGIGATGRFESVGAAAAGHITAPPGRRLDPRMKRFESLSILSAEGSGCTGKGRHSRVPPSPHVARLAAAAHRMCIRRKPLGGALEGGPGGSNAEPSVDDN